MKTRQRNALRMQSAWMKYGDVLQAEIKDKKMKQFYVFGYYTVAVLVCQLLSCLAHSPSGHHGGGGGAHSSHADGKIDIDPE